jgi:outer membrane protease
MTGLTDFRIYVEEYVPELQDNVSLESKLEFPLDISFIGLNFNTSFFIDSTSYFTAKLSASKNFNDPDASMKDRDWIGLPSMNYRVLFSSTESDAKVKAYFFELEFNYNFTFLSGIRFQPLIGYRYNYFKYKIFGVTGWQLDENSNRLHFNLYSGENILDYKVNYHILYLGLTTEINLSPKILLTGGMVYSPLTFADDEDIHILRNRIAISSCEGTANIYSVGLKMKLAAAEHLPIMYLGILYESASISSEGKQNQKWFGDDSTTPILDDTGTEYNGIDDEINSEYSTFKISLSIVL